MIVAIHQPNFLPWIGYFYKLSNCDLFVLLDNVQFSKNSFQNRSKIKTPQGEHWLTVPIIHKFGQTTDVVRIENSSDWRGKHLKTLEMSYNKAPYFDEVFSMLSGIYLLQPWELLSTFCTALTAEIMSYLRIGTPLISASSLEVSGRSTVLLLDILESVGATAYLSGSGGVKYQDHDLFRERGVDLRYSNFKHPVYKQLWGGFSSGLSLIDFLFNEGGGALAEYMRCSEMTP